MISRHTALAVLRVVSGLTILLGISGMIGGLLSAQAIVVFGAMIPAWPLGAIVAFVGVRYWIRIGNLQRKVRQGNVL